jgi:hypothetical protein
MVLPGPYPYSLWPYLRTDQQPTSEPGTKSPRDSADTMLMQLPFILEHRPLTPASSWPTPRYSRLVKCEEAPQLFYIKYAIGYMLYGAAI